MGAFNNGNIHEGEYVSIPMRTTLPINATASSTSSIPTPVRHQSPRPGRQEHIETCSNPRNCSFAYPDSSKESEDGVSLEEVLPLVHKWTHTHSILSVTPAPKKELIFCGTQDSNIMVFDLKSYNLKHVINCGKNHFATSVLCLTISEDERFLFSAGSDSLVKVWDLFPFDDIDATEYSIPCTHIVYSSMDIGDIFSIYWSEKLSALFIGSQNASIMWCHLPLGRDVDIKIARSIERLPHFRYDKFFDSKGPGGFINKTQSAHQMLKNSSNSEVNPCLVEIPITDMIRFAHNGYVYCMDFLTEANAAAFCDLHQSQYDSFLASCGGDGYIKIWGVTASIDGSISLSLINKLDNDESILSMHVIDSTICVGLGDSTVNAWDLTTCQLTRSFKFISPQSRADEVLSLCFHNGYIYKATNLGGLCKFPLRMDIHCDGADGDEKTKTHPIRSAVDLNSLTQDPWNLEEGLVFSVQKFRYRGSTYLLSGGLGSLCLWNLSVIDDSVPTSANDTGNILKLSSEADISNEHMLQSLRRIISYKTISKHPGTYLEDSRRCAQFLVKLLRLLGATKANLLPVPNCNPVVLGKFEKNDKRNTKSETKTLLWYGHYDVVEATADKECWSTDPFELVAKDGNLYARGVSDNKGPTLAAFYAVSDLHMKEELPINVVFIIEGEEECGSIGFQQVINEHKPIIGPVDFILLSNSYWLGDDVPCLNYGLRGVLNASLSVTSDKPDRHSGVDGGVSKEPTMDLIQILGQLICSNSNRIKIPGFYDDVLPIDETELKLYERIKEVSLSLGVTNTDLDTLLAKWRNPSLTIHRLDVSGPKNNTVISQRAQASVSIRVVPNQDLRKIKQAFTSYMQATFDSLKSENELKIDIFHEAEPWLGDPNNLVFKILYDNIKKHWGPSYPDPLFIREGGSIPSIRFLEKAFDAPAAQIPCGQASDNAHLKDEKLRIINLFKLRAILTDTFKELGVSPTA
ncbi:hypothetical_protein [Candidozyma auris]|uniref:glutamine amidotransferase subunit DUG2 n=1 Tax=Candidozyma auris TaxID=498019 RepID=UPI000D2A0EE7|nr:glutamine amidotransferase subunit DUG2 [[Candida] auris]QEO19516.1 hypothetical_protein [[Candida] auris]GBL50503.1 putative peptidase [[Candida] auris]